MLGSTKLENSMSKKGLGVLVDIKLNTSQPCACNAKEAGEILGFIRRRVGNPLLSAVEATPGVLCSALGSPVQKRHGKVERAGTVQSGADEVQRESQGESLNKTDLGYPQSVH